MINENLWLLFVCTVHVGLAYSTALWVTVPLMIIMGYKIVSQDGRSPLDLLNQFHLSLVVVSQALHWLLGVHCNYSSEQGAVFLHGRWSSTRLHQVTVTTTSLHAANSTIMAFSGHQMSLGSLQRGRDMVWWGCWEDAGLASQGSLISWYCDMLLYWLMQKHVYISFRENTLTCPLWWYTPWVSLEQVVLSLDFRFHIVCRKKQKRCVMCRLQRSTWSCWKSDCICGASSD